MNGIILGSFDPLTNGHLDLIQRAARLSDHLVVALALNSQKKALFSFEQRLSWLKEVLKEYENIEVISWKGLAVEAARKYDCQVMIKGLRNGRDFDYEQNIAAVNSYIDPDIETLSLFCDEKKAWISSSVIREMLFYQVDIQSLVPFAVYRDIQKKYYDQDNI